MTPGTRRAALYALAVIFVANFLSYLDRTLVSALEQTDYTVTKIPYGGLHLWVRLPSDRQASAVADAIRAHGVLVNAGDRFFPAEPPGAYLRLNFAAAASVTERAEAASRLSQQSP